MRQPLPGLLLVVSLLLGLPPLSGAAAPPLLLREPTLSRTQIVFNYAGDLWIVSREGGAGSGGDALPWHFRKAGLGPLVGKRTWGGLVGIGGYPELLDGGGVTAPRAAIYGLDGQWEVENHGVAPDYDVDLEPAAYRQGHDTQLEKAIEVILQLLKERPPREHPRPPYPNYHEHDGLGKS
jgi:hypothetical protein